MMVTGFDKYLIQFVDNISCKCLIMNLLYTKFLMQTKKTV